MPQSELGQYQAVITALIPFWCSGKMEQGIVKFKTRLPDQALATIRQEVERLCQPCSESVNTESFAKFALRTHRIDKQVEVVVDKVSEQILQEERDRYLGLYSRGVYERLMDPDYYQVRALKLKQQASEDKLTLESWPVDQRPPFGELFMGPPFKVNIPQLSKKPFAIKRLEAQNLCLVVPSHYRIVSGQEMILEFDAIKGLLDAPTKVNYRIRHIEGNADVDPSLTLTLALEGGEEWAKKVRAYVHRYYKNTPYPEPIQREILDHVVTRDVAMMSGKWLPVLCTNKQGEVVPRHVMTTDSNSGTVDALFRGTENVVCRRTWSEVLSDIREKGETYLIRCWHDAGDQRYFLTATLNKIVKYDALRSVIKKGLLNDSLQIFKCHLAEVTPELLKKAEQNLEAEFQTEDAKDLLAESTHIMYFYDLTRSLDVSPPKYIDHGLPEAFVEGNERFWPVVRLSDRRNNRRKETRYAIAIKANYHHSLLTQHDSLIRDFSASGMKLRVEDADISGIKVGDEIKVSAKALELKRGTFTVVGLRGNTFRLKTVNEVTRKRLNNFIRFNLFTLKSYCTDESMTSMYKAAWELCCRSQPAAHSLLSISSGGIPELGYTVHSDRYSKVLKPFLTEGKLRLHRLLSDPDESQVPVNRLSELGKAAPSFYISYFYYSAAKRKLNQFDLPRYMKSQHKEKLVNSVILKKARLMASLVQVEPVNRERMLISPCPVVDKRHQRAGLSQQGHYGYVLSVVPIGEFVETCVQNKIALKGFD